jgi:hypothetical protein
MVKIHTLYALYHTLSGYYVWTSDEIGLFLGGETPELRELNFWSSELDDEYLELDELSVPVTELEIHEYTCEVKVILDTDLYLKKAKENVKQQDRSFEGLLNKPFKTKIDGLIIDPVEVNMDDIINNPI